MANVTAKITPSLLVRQTVAVANGINAPINVDLPYQGASYDFATGTGALQAQVMYADTRTYAASTPQTFDLTALAAASTNTGAAAFAGVKFFRFVNNGTTDVTVGAAASNQFTGNWGGGTNAIVVPAGGYVDYLNTSAAGIVVDGTHKSLKVDPGAAACSFTIVLIGH